MATPPWFILIHNFENSGVVDSGETPICSCREEERSSRRVVLNKNVRPVPRREGEEMDGAGISTELELYPDPWKIKKKLRESDVGHLSRLLLPRGCVETHVLRPMGLEMEMEVEMRVKSRDGMEVTVWDADTGDEHRLVFRYWESSGSYVLNGGWSKLFVKGRGLKVGDEIGMLWDPFCPKFFFKVLSKVSRGTSNLAA